MKPAIPFGPVVLFVVPLLAGFGVGLLYFAALHRTVKRFMVRDGWLEPVALTVGRFGVAVAVLTFVARTGVTALLLTFLGFLLARTVTLHRSRSAA